MAGLNSAQAAAMAAKFEAQKVVIDGNTFLLGRPTPSQKIAVIAALKEAGVEYSAYQNLMRALIFDKPPDEDGEKTMLKIMELSNTTDFDSVIFSIWAKKSDLTPTATREQFGEQLRAWYTENGSGASLFNFFAAAQ